MNEGDSTKTNLVTMNDSEGDPLSFDSALLSLIQILMMIPSLRELIRTLGEIAHVLYRNKTDEANQILIKKYLPSAFHDLFPPLKSSGGTINFLFTLSAIRLLSNLLVFQFDERRVILDPMILVRNRLHIPQPGTDVQFSIVPLFLLANQLIAHVENDSSCNNQTYLDCPRIYYSRLLEDPLAVIARGLLLFNTEYFNKKLRNLLGMTVFELLECLFLLFAHVLAREPANIKPEVTFRRIIRDDRKLRIRKVLDFLSVEVQSMNVQYSQIASTLHQNYFQDKIYRGRPFLKIKDRYICIRPDLITSAFCDFPYHYMLNALSEKNAFFKEYGKAFDQYIIKISQRSFGDKSIQYHYKKKPYKGNPSSDFHLEIDKYTRVIIEIKGSQENDDVRTGIKQALCHKFIYLGGTFNKPKGVFQIIKDAEKFRNDFPFSGEIFTVIIFSGQFPETTDFDELVKCEIEDDQRYKEYLSDKRNFPTIWLSSSTAELLFSATIQKINVKELLNNISSVPPSRVRNKIVEYLSENNKKISLEPLFKNELDLLSTISKKMFN